jgi:hypothetical protein
MGNCANCHCSHTGPCATTTENTPENETLPSQIENFTTQFFGEVTKTGSAGVVQWILPCDLDVGLPNNPRADGEGLACYFLRLFDEGIVGLTGPQGDTGANGANGYNAFSVTTLSFTQPTLAAPIVQVRTAYNPALLPNLYVFIQTSGWYLVNAADITGVLTLTLVREISGASGSITAGKLVVPSGFPGASVTGATGPQGPQGAQGIPGESLTEANGEFGTTIGIAWATPFTYAPVDFVTSSPEVLLPVAGRYLLTATVSVRGDAGIGALDSIYIKMFNSSSSADVPNSEQQISHVEEGQKDQIVISVLYNADLANQTISLHGRADTDGVASVLAPGTKFNFIRIE